MAAFMWISTAQIFHLLRLDLDNMFQIRIMLYAVCSFSFQRMPVKNTVYRIARC